MVSRARRSRHSSRKERAGFRLGIVGVVIAAILGIGCLGTAGVCFAWLQDLPDYTDASAYNVAEKTKVYASDGTTLLAELYLENRDPSQRISGNTNEKIIESYQKRLERARGKADVIIGKNRHGRPETVRLAFFGDYSLFDNLDEMESRANGEFIDASAPINTPDDMPGMPSVDADAIPDDMPL